MGQMFYMDYMPFNPCNHRWANALHVGDSGSRNSFYMVPPAPYPDRFTSFMATLEWSLGLVLHGHTTGVDMHV